MVSFTDIQVPLILTANSVAMEIAPSVTCGATTDHFFTHYTYSASHTPTIHEIFPRVFSYDNDIDAFASGLAITSFHNLFTIGGKPCYYSSSTSLGLVHPDFSGPADATIAYHTLSEIMIDCEVIAMETGVHRPVLHVAGKGWGLVANSAVVEVLPSLELDDPAGSLRGGTLLAILTRGLMTHHDITRLRVEIGNTLCVVQQIDTSSDPEFLYCLTRPARDDGYSSLVRALHPISYWTLQTDFYDLDGSYVGTDGVVIFRNSGDIGSAGDGLVRGEVEGRKEGISGNAITNQAVLFNNSYIEVPFNLDYVKPEGFGIELWLKLPSTEEEVSSGDDLGSGDELTSLPMETESGSGDDLGSGDELTSLPMETESGSGDDLGSGDELTSLPMETESGSGDDLGSGDELTSLPMETESGSGEGSGEVGITPSNPGPYQIVVDFTSYSDGVTGGYAILINPCGQLEFWVATDIDYFPDTETCSLLSASDCSPSTPAPCSGLSVVATGYLPTGVWSVIRCSDCELGTEWALVSAGWELDKEEEEDTDDSLMAQSGTQVLYFNSRLVGSVTTTYSTPSERPLLIGGTDRLSLSEGLVEGLHVPLTGFQGYVDEVSVHHHPLSGKEAKELFMYGSTEKQKVWIRVEPVDGIGIGHNLDKVLKWNGAFNAVQNLDWNGVSDSELEIDEGKALFFEWTDSLKGVWEVTKATYESCDITDDPIKEWSPPRVEGEVVVWMEYGETHYFIDPVAGSCLAGSRLKVYWQRAHSCKYSGIMFRNHSIRTPL